MLLTGHFLTGDEDEIGPLTRREGHFVRINELVVLAQYQKVVTAAVVPAGYSFRGRVGMTAQHGVAVGVALIPCRNYFCLLAFTAGSTGEKHQAQSTTENDWFFPFHGMKINKFISLCNFEKLVNFLGNSFIALGEKRIIP